MTFVNFIPKKVVAGFIFLFYDEVNKKRGVILGEVLADIFYKIFIGLISGLIMLFFKPVRRRLKKTKLYSFIMRKLGKERYKVIVTGRIFHNSNLRIEICFFEVELPYKDISENAMPIDQSNDLIIREVNKKYGKNFNSRDHFLNNIDCKNVTYYQKDED